MAQGASKAKSAKSGSIGSAKKKAGRTRPGKREVAPKAKAKIVAKSQEKVSWCYVWALADCRSGLGGELDERGDGGNQGNISG